MRILLLLCLFTCLAFTAGAQVDADFTANTTSGCPNPLFVILDDASTTTSGTINSWSWTVTGPGGFLQTGALDQLTLTLTTPGFYTVELTVGSSAGGSDTETRVDFIEVFGRPTISYTFSPDDVCGPQEVCFDGTIDPGCGTIASLVFDIGGGTTYSTPDFCHSFTATGQFTGFPISVTNSCGCSTSETFQDTVDLIDLPDADFTGAPTTACSPPLTTNFNNLSSGAGPLQYDWTFEGHGTSTSTNPSILFGAGVFDVQLVVEDANGCTDTLVRTDYIATLDPNANFTSNVTAVCEGLPVSFQNTSAGSPTSLQWSFPGGSPASSTADDPVVTYATTGSYDVELIANYSGCADTLLLPNYITVSANGTPSFTISESSGCAIPSSTTFESTTAGTASTEWIFPSGTPSSFAGAGPVTVTYGALGTYDAILIETFPGCQPDTTTISGAFTLAPLDATLEGDPAGGCVPLTAGLSVATNVDSAVSWDWTLPGSDIGASVADTARPTYAVQDCYDVEVIVTTAGGCTDTIIEPDFVCADTVPTASFVNDLDTICYEETVCFDFTGNGADSVFYDFDDGVPQFLPANTQACHVYIDSAGTFDPFIVAFNGTCPADTTFGPTVTVLDPIADFEDSVNCEDTYTVYFENLTENADSFFWDFGDTLVTTDTSSGMDAQYTYPSTGTYEVSLTACSSITGCCHTVLRDIFIWVPDAFFVPDDSLITCAPRNITFTNTSPGTAPGWPNTLWDPDLDGVPDVNRPSRSFAYPTPGVFGMSMINIDRNGCRDTLTRDSLIYVNDALAGFTQDARGGCAPHTVNFVDTSSSFLFTVTDWFWDFGDTTRLDDTSRLQNPAWTYTDTGLYDVTLVVVDSFGCRDSITREDYISVTAPGASFAPSLDFICDGQCVSFTDQSIGGSLTYDWTFPDGIPATSTDPNPGPICFSPEGVKNVLLEVTDTNGCTSDTIVPIDVFDVQASFTPSIDFLPCPVPFTPILFTNTSVNNVDSSSAEWFFGDGTTSTVFSPSKIYTTPGVFEVFLVMSSQTGCTDTSAVDTIVVDGPWGDIDVLGDSAVCRGDTVDFLIRSLNAVNPFLILGDGRSETFTPTGPPGDTAVNIISLPYSAIGEYVPGLFLDDGNCSFVYEDEDTVIVDSVVIGFHDSLATCSYDVFFEDTSFSRLSGHDIQNVFWDFGDPTTPADTSGLANPSYTYPGGGAYDVTLFVESGSGCVDSLVRTIRVQALPEAHIAHLDTSVCLGATVSFVDSSIVDDSTSIASWAWTFDGTATDSVQSPSFTYDSAGAFTPVLTIADTFGCVDSDSAAVVVTDPPAASFIDSLACLNAPETLISTSVPGSFGGSPIVSWSWDLDEGAGFQLLSDTVDHVFTVFGTRNVTLAVEDDAGCRDSVTQDYFIDSLITTTTPDLSGICNQEVCISHVSQSELFGDNITGVFWDFGDTTIASDTAVTDTACHAYADRGTYGISLTVSTATGCEVTMVDSVFVRQAPAASFEISDSAGCEPVAVDFTNTSAVDPGGSVASWAWTFDGVATSGVEDPPPFTYTTFGTYTPQVIVEDDAGCRDTAMATVQVFDLPSASFTYDPGCLGGEPSIFTSTSDAGVDGLNPITSYSWDVDDGVGFTTGAAVQETFYGAPGSYDVTLAIEDAGGCRDTATSTIVVDPTPDAVITIPGDTALCEGTGAINPSGTSSTGAGPLSYEWDFDALTAPGVDDTTDNPIAILYPVGPDRIELVITDVNGCTDTARQGVVVYENPEAFFEDPGVCEDIPVAFDDASTEGDWPIASWSWVEDGAALIGTTPSSNAQTYPSPGSVTICLDIEDDFGCVDQFCADIDIDEQPDVNLVNADTICPDSVAAISLSGADAYTWSPMQGVVDFDTASSTLFVQPDATTTYSITGSSANGSCPPDVDASVQVNVVNEPDIFYTADPNPSFAGAPTEVQLDVIGRFDDIDWFDHPDITLLDPQATIAEVGRPNADSTYLFRVAYERLGVTCFIDSFVRLNVIDVCDEEVIFIPNIFTPNDDTRNDFFYIKGRGIDRVDVLRVFNRWGEVVFEGTGLEPGRRNQGWDGRAPGGQRCNLGVYVYQYEVTCANGEVFTGSGNVTLAR